MKKDTRKIIRRVKVEIFEMGYHTMTSERGLYETDLEGTPTTDVFKDCVNTVTVREKMFSTYEGQQHLKSAFKDNKAEFVIAKVNKRGTQRFIVTREEYRKIARKKFKS